MLLPVHRIINPIPDYRFYQVLSGQREPCIARENVLVTYLGVLAVDGERTANCSIGHRVSTSRLWSLS